LYADRRKEREGKFSTYLQWVTDPESFEWAFLDESEMARHARRVKNRLIEIIAAMLSVRERGQIPRRAAAGA
jgi:hypothetical protein